MSQDFYSLERKNNRKSLTLVCLYVVMIGTVGLVVDIATGTVPYKFPVFTMAALAFASAHAFFIILWGGPFIVKLMNAFPLAEIKEFKYNRALNVVQELCIASGVPMPRVYVIPEPFPNAMSVGGKDGRACICLTTGLIMMMERDELQAVIAHEFAHIASGDSKFMMFVIGLEGAVVLVSDFFLLNVPNILKARSRRPGGWGSVVLLSLFGVSFALVSPAIARVVRYSISRFREFSADAAGVRFTRNPRAMISALEKIKRYSGPVRGRYRVTSAAFFVDFFRRDVNSVSGVFSNIANTHPPIDRRIAVLKAVAGEPLSSKSSRSYPSHIHLPCPGCGAELAQIKARTKFGPLAEVDACVRCGGIWFDKYEIYQVSEDADSLFKELEEKAPKKVPEFLPRSAKGPLNCPRCGVKLEAFKDTNFPPHINARRCPLCSGMWISKSHYKLFTSHRRKRHQKINSKPESFDQE